MADDNLWFRIGYRLERARREPTPARLASLAERRASDVRGKDESGGPLRPGSKGEGADTYNALVVAGSAALASRVLAWWPPRRRPGVLGLVRAGAAGAGAALLARLLRPLVRGEARLPNLDDRLADALLAGAARGLVYATVVEPRVVGSPLIRGVLYGSLEYIASPWGGLVDLLGGRAPHRRIPVLADLFEGYDPEEDAFVDHIAFAVALSLLYGEADLGDRGEEPTE